MTVQPWVVINCSDDEGGDRKAAAMERGSAVPVNSAGSRLTVQR
ncbi:hypothetical protein ACWGI9_20080 [Streptomyces sp. NPDC054833]